MKRNLFWTLVFGSAGIAVFAIVYIMAWYCDMGHAAIDKMPFLTGKSIDEVESILGTPDEVQTIPLEQIRDDFRCELLNYYSPAKAENKGIKFKELSWKRSRYTITVWFHQVGDRWVSLDTCRWRKGTVF
jgi:hypothetical protein